MTLRYSAPAGSADSGSAPVEDHAPFAEGHGDGGGHGLYGSLSALRHVTPDLTAVVTVADDGGSSGRLREEMGILPPGDLRMALSALCDDTDGVARGVMYAASF
ncbi:2-phospho-L-lactate transferase CofD family protein [Rothia mucilaginosa]|uniref:2-phospho-L-lactate transferase CofD family protein n=1 Tax=Rothia mucilaginosa TaxID=43675 RepID=UPI00214C97A5|nr:2-phospho-L-lactate transferase CofD family protein [Rothia mucilaginosa]